MTLDRLIGAILGLVPGLGRWYETPGGRKKVRYAMVSAVAVPTGTAFIAVGRSVLGLTPGWAFGFGNSMGAIPSYILNRYWAWGKTGRNHLVTEILPFWALTLVGVVFSLEVGHEAGHFTKNLVLLLAANIAAFGILWVGKYMLFNKVLFVVRHHGERPGDPAEAALD